MLKLSGIRKCFVKRGLRVRALNGVDLELQQGQFIALMGPSGSGKTTLLNVLGLLDVPDEGSYTWYGRELVGTSESDRTNIRRGNIGFVFQGFNLLRDRTALENVELPLLGTTMAVGVRRDRAREILELAGMGECCDRLPHQLSGGQQQRVAVARAVVGDPRLLLADEPTGDLDEAGEAEVLDLLKTVSELGTTVLMATHSGHAASQAQARLQMRDGIIVPDGSSFP